MRDTDLAITFFTFLTLLANAATLGLAGTAGAARLTGRPAARRAWARLHREVAGGAVGLAWLVAAVAMSGSLYFSEVAGFTPCHLCWAQRACMYPLVALLAVAGVTRRPAWRALSLGLATVGAGIAVYHVLVERFPTLESGTCDPTNPCSLVWFERYGFVTLPYMALSGFALIGALLLTASVRSPAADPSTVRPATAPAARTASADRDTGSARSAGGPDHPGARRVLDDRADAPSPSRPGQRATRHAAMPGDTTGPAIAPAASAPWSAASPGRSATSPTSSTSPGSAPAAPPAGSADAPTVLEENRS